jgi:hypothetical protein
MKTFVIFFLCMSSFIFSQNNNDFSDLEREDIKELPEIVLRKIGDDFSIYLPDQHPDYSVQQMQKYFIAYNLGKDYEGYDSYLVIMENDKGTLTATYNNNGKLTRVVEKYENVKLPNEVVVSVLKAFPGWGIVDDKYNYTQEDGDVKKQQYVIHIKKDNKKQRLVVDSTGEILKGL